MTSPWDVELLLARDSENRRALANDARRGITRRVRHGVWVAEADLVDLPTEDRHVVAMRAAAVVSDRPLVFSHWSAAAVLGLETLPGRLGTMHATFASAGERGLEGVSSHLLRVDDAEVHGLRVTRPGRTVVDIAASGTFEEGVVVADSALRAGVPRHVLEAAVDLSAGRRGAGKMQAAVEFADERSGSVGESTSRVTMHRMGLRPELQRRHHDHRGYIGATDFFFTEEEAIGEFDGRVKFVDPRYAPSGAAQKLWEEKQREDRLRAVSRGFARWGWPESRDPRKLAPVLRAAGVRVHPRF